jgi:hypothetical protein
MKVDFGKMCGWERTKAIFIMKIANELDMDLSESGEIDVNPDSGNTYLWLEDYPFYLYMPISCELVKSDIWALWSDADTDEETEISLNDNIHNWEQIEKLKPTAEKV